MAEEAQELTVTNTGQPATVDLIPAVTPVEVAQTLVPAVPTNVSIDLIPVSS